MIHSVFDICGFTILIFILIVLLVLESIFKLRKRFVPRFKRFVLNIILAIPAFSLLRLMLIPALFWVASKNESLHFGLNYLYFLPVSLENIFAFVLLDYGIYWWHIILHRLPLMWRFHLVHHTDIEMDVTTAFRFHFGEMIGSVIFRSGVVLLIGVSPLMVLIYEIIFEAETQFHHSNIKLQNRFERILNKVIVTPRMHGIHHSVIKHETDSNYATIFSFWDRLHNTIRLNIHQNGIVIGVPAYCDVTELTAGKLFKLPFTKIREWEDEKRKTNGSEYELKN